MNTNNEPPIDLDMNETMEGAERPENRSSQEGATVVITHRIKAGQNAAYEAWLNEIGPVCRSFPGHLNWQSIKPIPGMMGTYTMVIRFDTQQHLEAWMYSEQRKAFVARVKPLLASDDKFHISTGLDFWFAPEGTVGTAPRWKQAVVTFAALVPLVLITPILLHPIFTISGVSNTIITTSIGTGFIVIMMAYVVMPPFTKLIRSWLYN